MTLRMLSLFSGIGGLDLAAQRAGIEVVAFSEVKPFACRVLERHFPGVPNLGDVRFLCRRVYDCLPENEDGDVICQYHGIDFGECECIDADQFLDEFGGVDIVAGGVPCQPSSHIGKRRGAGDARWLWPDTIRVMRELQPRYGLFEQPTGILSLDGGRAFNGILSSFYEIGFDVWWEVIPACAVGAPHRRERVWIVAHSNSARLEGYAGHGEGEEGRTQPDRHAGAGCLRPGKDAAGWWESEPVIQRVVNGVPGRVDRIDAIGNAVVPQVAYPIFEAIARTEAA